MKLTGPKHLFNHFFLLESHKRLQMVEYISMYSIGLKWFSLNCSNVHLQTSRGVIRLTFECGPSSSICYMSLVRLFMLA